jgi:hypothetical protein
MGFIPAKDLIILLVDLLALPTKARIEGKKDIVFKFIIKYYSRHNILLVKREGYLFTIYYALEIQFKFFSQVPKRCFTCDGCMHLKEQLIL